MRIYLFDGWECDIPIKSLAIGGMAIASIGFGLLSVLVTFGYADPLPERTIQSSIFMTESLAFALMIILGMKR